MKLFLRPFKFVCSVEHAFKVCLRQRDLLNYGNGILKADILKKLTIRQLWQSPLFLLNPLQKKLFLTKYLTFKFKSAAFSAEAIGSKRNMSAFLDLRWWQHRHCSAAGFIGSIKPILTPRIQLRLWDPTIPFTLCSRRFATKIAFVVTFSKAQNQTLQRVEIYPSSPVFFFSHVPLDVAFYRNSSFPNVADNYWMILTAYRKW